MTTEQDEDLAFEQAFNAATAPPAHQDAPEKEQPEAPADAAQATAPEAVATPEKTAEPAEDPFASLPQAVRDLLARVPALEARLEQTTRVANMVPALQSRIDRMNQPSPATEQVPAKSRFAKIDALRNDLPEIADALDEIVAAQHRPEPQGQSQQPEPQAGANPHEDALSSVRPTWADDLTSGDFQLWLAQQPRDFQAHVQGTNKAGDILAALGRFDAFRAQTQTTKQLTQTRSTRMAAVTPQGDGRRQRAPVPFEDEEEAAFSAAFNKTRGRG